MVDTMQWKKITLLTNELEVIKEQFEILYASQCESLSDDIEKESVLDEAIETLDLLIEKLSEYS